MATDENATNVVIESPTATQADWEAAWSEAAPVEDWLEQVAS